MLASFIKLLVFLIFSLCQENLVEGKIIDTKSKESIPLVSISKSSGQTGTYSDDNGKFSISLGESDSLYFSAVGYKRKYLTFKEIKESGCIIALEEYVQELESVVVRPRKVKSHTVEIGYHHSKMRSSYAMRTAGSQVAVFLENPEKKEGFIETIYMKLRSVSNFKILIRIYDKNNAGLPGKDLLPENLIMDVKKFNGILSIDVSSKNVLFPVNGAFVCLQTIEDQGRNAKDTNGSDKYSGTYLSEGDNARNTYDGFRDRYWEKEGFSVVDHTNSNVMIGAKIRFYSE